MKQTIIAICSIRYNSVEQAYQTHKAMYTGCRFWGIRCHQADANLESCDQVKGQNWMRKILTMMALCMHPMTFQAVTQVALTGYEGTVNYVEEQQALAIVPGLFSDQI